MALKIKCNYNETSNLRFPYVVRTLHLKFHFSNKRDAQRFCKQRTKDLKNLYICVLDSYTDALLLVMEKTYRDLPLSRAVEQIQYFIEHPDYREDVLRYERVCAAAVSALIIIYRNSLNSKRMAKQWENTYNVYFANIAKPFCEGKILITKCR